VINNQILDTADYEFITFTPTSLAGLPEFVVPGEEVAFQINGDLTIRDITQPVTFEVVVTADSETSIAGLATAVVQRADFGLVIPSVPGVADVTEDVELELDFTASIPVQ
jgi:polyisoprenoid-binding protein YceI